MVRRLGAATLVTLILSTNAACSAAQTVEPPAVVEAANYSEDELMQLREEFLIQLAERRNIANPPEIELIRWISLSEFGPTMVDCLVEQGYDVKLTPDQDGIDYTAVPQNVGASLMLADYICNAQYSVDPRYSAPLTDSQLQLLYYYYVVDLIPCLEAEGYDFNEPPSYAVFAEEYSGPAGWAPYNEVNVGALSIESFAELEATCPQQPAQSELYPFSAQ